ncbi:MAG: histidine phosphatase family protein [Simkaniaceae bacterium]|nr:histidine phosphatase family protein [Simkaniaceae bacterium]
MVTPVFKTDIYLVRHGHTVSEGQVLGRDDAANEGLSKVGQEEADHLAQVMQQKQIKPAAIYSSRLRRAIETAEWVNQLYKHEKIHQKAALDEIGMGSSERLTLKEKKEKYQEKQAVIKAEHPDRKERWLYPVVGESMASLHCRVIMQLVSIAEEHQNEAAFVFTHGKVIASILADCLDVDEDAPVCMIDHCRVVHLQIEQESDGAQYIQIIDCDWNANTRKHSRHGRDSRGSSLGTSFDDLSRRLISSNADTSDARKTSSGTSGVCSSTTSMSASNVRMQDVGGKKGCTLL